MRYIKFMKDDRPIVELFKAAYLQLVPVNGRSGKQKEIVYESGVPQSTISSIMAGRREGTEEQRRAIAAALGYNYDAFLDLGRRALGLPVTAKNAPVHLPPADERLLTELRETLASGGEKAEELRAFLAFRPKP